MHENKSLYDRVLFENTPENDFLFDGLIEGMRKNLKIDIG